MRKAVGLNDFNRGQIEMSPKLRTIISKTALYASCTLLTIVSIHVKWMYDETSSRRHGAGCPRVIKKKEPYEKDVRLDKVQSTPDNGSDDSPIQCSSKNCFGPHSLTDIGGYGTMLQTSHSYTSVDQASSATTSTMGTET